VLTYPTYLDHLQRDAALLADAGALGLDADVPGCPGWKMRDLVVHIARVQIQKADIVEQGLVESWPATPVLPDGIDPLDWYRAGAARVVEVLSQADPAAPAKTWAEEQTVGFWIRRLALETVIHRIDAEQAHGYESPVDRDLAIDGIAELFDVMITGYPDWATFTPDDGVIRVDAGDQSWTVRFGRMVGRKRDRDYDRQIVVFEESAEPGAVVSGAPDRVLLWMWGRAPQSEVVISGDPALAIRLREVCSI